MPYASASFHNIRTIRASSTCTSGAPLTLNLIADHGESDNAQVIIFIGDQALADRLIEAINRVTGHPLAVEEPATSEGSFLPHSFKPHPDDYRD
jgi:hypothetical protein